MARDQRIKELISRQIYYGSSLAVKLRKVKSVIFYDVYLWLDQGKTDNKILVRTGIYQNQDPNELFDLVESEIGKYKLGKRKELLH